MSIWENIRTQIIEKCKKKKKIADVSSRDLGGDGYSGFLWKINKRKNLIRIFFCLKSVW